MISPVQHQLEHSLDVLDVAPGQSWEDVEKQYRQLVQRWHPDRNSEEANDVAQSRFIEINSAFKLVREYYRKNGTVPKRIPPVQHEPLLGIKKQTHVKPAFYKSKLFLVSCIGLGVLMLFAVILLSLDARMTQQNRHRADAELVRVKIEATEQDATSNTAIEQSSNAVNP